MITQEQLDKRYQGIGASEIGDVFNLEPYGCRRRLFYRKKQVAPDYALIPTVAMERGNFFEPIVADLYREKTGRLVKEYPDTIRAKTGPLFCHLDRLTVIVENDGVPLEIKVPGERMFNEFRRQGVSETYILQIQTQIHLIKADVGSFGIFCPDNVGFLAPDVERDESIIKEVVSACSLFWDEMTAGKEPDRLKPTDKRCSKCNWRTSCQGKHLLASVKDTAEPEMLSLESDPLMDEYWRAKEIAGEAGELLDSVKARIKAMMGDRGIAETNGSRIFFKPVVSNKLDTKALKHDEPEIAKKYLKESISRPLKIYAI